MKTTEEKKKTFDQYIKECFKDPVFRKHFNNELDKLNKQLNKKSTNL